MRDGASRIELRQQGSAIMKILFAGLRIPESGTTVAAVLEGKKLSPSAAALDRRSGGALVRAMEATRFAGKKEETLVLPALTGFGSDRVVLLGVGKPAELTTQAMQRLGGILVPALNGVGATAATVLWDDLVGAPLETGIAAANLAHGAVLRSYRFDKYRTRQKPEQKPSLARLTVLSSGQAAARKAYQPLERIGDGVFFTRDLVSEPANVLYPKSFVERARALRSVGVTTEILDERAMRKLGMGALLGVGQGSAKPPRLLVMQYNGAGSRGRNKAPVAFIGKGVTF